MWHAPARFLEDVFVVIWIYRCSITVIIFGVFVFFDDNSCHSPCASTCCVRSLKLRKTRSAACQCSYTAKYFFDQQINLL